MFKTLFTTLALTMATFMTASAGAQTITGSLAVTSASGMAGERHAVSIAHLMSDEEIEATGLRSLEPEQLAALSQWLERFQRTVAERVMESAEEDFAPSDAVIDSRIQGGFDGWVGDTVFRLENGQVWQQVSPSAKYYTAQAPRVTITRSPYLMHVDGVTIDIEVRRIK